MAICPFRKNRHRLLAASFLVLAMVAVGVWLYGRFFGSPSEPAELGPATVQLKEQPVYRVKRKQDLLGVKVTRIVSRRQPEEFLVLDGVSDSLVDSVYGKPVDLTWANLMANQFLRLREGVENGASSVSVEIQEVKTLKSGTMQVDGKTLPYWQIEVKFRLSNESQPRYYQAGVIRRVKDGADKSGKDTLVVAYAQKEAFEGALVAELMQYLAFEPK